MPPPAPPAATLAVALQRSEALTGLLQRMQQSRARREAIGDLLPPGLQSDVRAGPLDDSAWVLLVAHAAAAAKVRQLLPALQARLAERGWPTPPVRIKVLPRA